MKILNKIPLLALLLLSFISTVANALVISVDFTRVEPSNNVEDLSSQLGLDIYDATMANAMFSTGLTVDQVLFAYSNDVGIPSNIAEVYIDDGTVVSLVSVLNSLGGGGFTNFDGDGMASPGDLPGGENLTPPFEATSGFLADVNPGPPSNGIDALGDILGMVYDTDSGINGIGDALDDGSLRVGLHIRSIGREGGSDSYVNDGHTGPGPGPAPGPVPEPGILALFGAGLSLLAMRRRRMAR